MNKRYLIILFSIIGVLSCSRIDNARILGLRIGNHYTADEIISTIGTQGDFVDITQGICRTNINYRDLVYDGIEWDMAGVSIAGGKNTFWNAKFVKEYNDKKTGRENLYRLKEELDRKYKSSSTKREDGDEFFWYADAKGFIKGGSVGLGYEHNGNNSYSLILQYRLKGIDQFLDMETRKFFQSMREGTYSENHGGVDIESTISEIERESW